MSQSGNTFVGKSASIINDESYYYIGLKGSPFGAVSFVVGLNSDEILALSERFPKSEAKVSNGIMITGPPLSVINALAELGYRVIGTTGDIEIFWTLRREL
ncbi:uncharacterized protein LOC122528804 isoform X5 [Frieseomelitta varia]|uniref:uncharacterized protein LOC122528804 isoform X5 n=1 Tax=Frieseomelitta varia TaxID=561572 RepID=UPI001CB6A9DC|nr:uncharacterized protein LOC122528804 isoform X5 [Frieseomelitta varia]XP_043510254.1 uncharacterized protein LOC122528804 isoform X5 [Frieseomelitta varia]XP_043510255.1 uncharacterized protein LOC122528804 isoform X5 [Frieseomelitta varia]XP_043510256.1 uncharacterized protein LOC122528804 isoform X5 [Frieseomelitta varia]XP_043510257.1 uncharacterized protein LOC122528804 isoform X5 [Frieseomelitta varia]